MVRSVDARRHGDWCYYHETIKHICGCGVRLKKPAGDEKQKTATRVMLEKQAAAQWARHLIHKVAYSASVDNVSDFTAGIEVELAKVFFKLSEISQGLERVERSILSAASLCNTSRADEVILELSEAVKELHGLKEL